MIVSIELLDCTNRFNVDFRLALIVDLLEVLQILVAHQYLVKIGNHAVLLSRPFRLNTNGFEDVVNFLPESLQLSFDA